MKFTAAAIASIALLGLALASSSFAAGPPRPKSAQAAWHAARDAYSRGDYRTYMGTVAPAAYDECICQLASIVSHALGVEHLEPEYDLKPLNKILNRYGVLSAEAPAFRADSLNAPGLWGREAISRIGDKKGLYHNVMRYLRKKRVGPKLPSLFTLELGDVVVEGTKARATLSGRERLRPEAKQVIFEQHGDAWYVALPPICLNDLPAVDTPLP